MQSNKKELAKLNNLINSLNKSGYLAWTKKLQKEFPESELYLVGGAVRDSLLGINIKDIKDLDFVVRHVSISKLENFLSTLGWIEKLGKTFGVLKFKQNKFSKQAGFEPFDIALPRSEFSIATGGYKDFTVKFDKDLSIKDDLLRRDFTINAIALKIYPNLELIDPFNGIYDLKNKKINCVGKPQERLTEDYTRIMRAVRFACQLNFEIDPKTISAIKKITPHLNDKKENNDWISPREVIAKEFLKSFLHNPLLAIELFDKLNIFKILAPQILKMKKCEQPAEFHSEGDVWQHTLLALQNLNSKKYLSFNKKLSQFFDLEKIDNKKSYLELIIALFLHDIGKPYTIQKPTKQNGLDRLRFNNHDTEGAKIAEQICKNLALSSPDKFGINCQNVSWLIQKHMMLLHGNPSEFRPTTIEKNFFSEKYPGINLIRLAFLDSLATIPKTGKLEKDLIGSLLKRIKEMQSLITKKQFEKTLPQEFLTGAEIMQIKKIKAGPQIGQLKNELRELQLSGNIKTKQQAIQYLKSGK